MQLTDAGHGRVASHTGTNSLGRNGGTVKRENGRIVFVPYVDVYGTGFEDMRRRIPRISKIETYTGWEPKKSLDQILQDVVTEFAAESMAMPVTA
jgi:nucleoside-diphosphate-sugar epimerase